MPLRSASLAAWLAALCLISTAAAGTGPPMPPGPPMLLWNITNYVRLMGDAVHPFTQDKQRILERGIDRSVPLCRPTCRPAVLAFKETRVTTTGPDGSQSAIPAVDVAFQLLAHSPIRLPEGNTAMLKGFQTILEQTMAAAGYSVAAKTLYDRVAGPLQDEPPGQYLAVGLTGDGASNNSTAELLGEALAAAFEEEGLYVALQAPLAVPPLGAAPPTTSDAPQAPPAPSLLVLRVWSNDSLATANANAEEEEEEAASAKGLAALLTARAVTAVLGRAEAELAEQGLPLNLTLLSTLPPGGFPGSSNLTVNVPRSAPPNASQVLTLLELSGPRLKPFSALKQATLVGLINAAPLYAQDAEEQVPPTPFHATIIAIDHNATAAAPPPTATPAAAPTAATGNSSAPTGMPGMGTGQGGRRLQQQQAPAVPPSSSGAPAGAAAPLVAALLGANNTGGSGAAGALLPGAAAPTAAATANDTVRVLLQVVMPNGAMIPAMQWELEAAVQQGMGEAGFPVWAQVLDSQIHLPISQDTFARQSPPTDPATADPASEAQPTGTPAAANLTASADPLPEMETAVAAPDTTQAATGGRRAPGAVGSSPAQPALSPAVAAATAVPTSSPAVDAPAAPAEAAADADGANSDSSLSSGAIAGIAAGAAALAALAGVVAAFVIRRRGTQSRRGQRKPPGSPRTAYGVLPTSAASTHSTFLRTHPAAGSLATTTASISKGVDIELALSSELEPFSPKGHLGPAVGGFGAAGGFAAGVAAPRLGGGGQSALGGMSKDQAVDRALGALRRRALRLSTLDSNPAMPGILLAAHTCMQPGSSYAERYLIEGVCCQGPEHVLLLARDEANGIQVVIKNFGSVAAFDSEHAFYSSQFALHPEVACRHVPVLCDAFTNSAGPSAPCPSCGTSVPPALVLERGSFTLEAWLAGAAGEGMLPLSDSSRVDCLYGVAKALEFLHGQGYVHGRLTPSHVMYFEGERAWKLVGLGGVAAQGERRPDHLTPAGAGAALRYATPELLLAELMGEAAPTTADRAADLWALGVLAFEVLAGGQLFPPDSFADEDVAEVLLGYRPLPFEADPGFLAASGLQPAASSLVVDLVRRSAAARKPVRTVVQSPLFNRPSGGTPRFAALLGSITGPWTTLYGSSSQPRRT